MKLTAETFIRGPLEQVWRLSQTPAEHVRWDARFTNIEYLPKASPEAAQRFRYATDLGVGQAVEGWGETLAEKNGSGSSLRFGSDDLKSLVREGQGCWLYRQEEDGVRFSTVYDYTTHWGRLGRLVDQIVFRPLMIWTTRWSFDRLRLWVERGLLPEITLRLWMLKFAARLTLASVWILEGLLPKILFVDAEEVELVRRSGLFVATPVETLAALGLAEIAAGLILLTGWAERTGAFVSAVALGIFTCLVLAFDPAALIDPYGGILKNLGLFLCALAIWMLEPLTPKARRARGAKRGNTNSQLPFTAVLGEAANTLAPKVRDHFLSPPGRRSFRGTLRVWRRTDWRGRMAGPFLWLGGKMETLFTETGDQVPFELENVVTDESDGRATMTWSRTFHFPSRTRRFTAVMHFDPHRRVLVDRLGAFRHLEVELHARVEEGALVLSSGRQWFRIDRLRLPLPRWFSGQAHVREWQRMDGRLGIRVTIGNPLLGEFFGYEGEFDEVAPKE